MSSTDLPLRGLRVVDTIDGTGDLCGRLLADLGAEVIRVEPPGGASARRQPPLIDDHSVWFAYRNANKASVVLDLAEAGDLERFDRLLAHSDVLLEAGVPGAGAFDPVAIADQHRHLVVLSMADFGQTGPYAQFASSDGVVSALAGMVFKAGTPDREPLLPPGTVAYDSASVMAAFGVVTALWQRRTTGVGQYLDFSVVEAVAQLADWSMSNASAGRNAGRPGSELRAGAGPVYPLFKCKEGYVRLVVLSPRSWAAMLEWLGNPDYLQDPELATFIGRFGIADAVLNPLYEELFSTMTSLEVATQAQERGIVCTPVIEPDDIVTNVHFASRNTFTPIEVAPGIDVPLPDGLFEIDEVRQGLRRPAPQLGADTDAIFADLGDVRIAPAASPAPSAPLAGLRVMDFGHGGVGVECGRLFAEYGAEVFKIESVAYVDFIRTVLGGNFSPSFVSSNRSKLGFGANAKTEDGRAVLKQLAVLSDLIIENNSTGTMDQLGVSYADFAAVNPGIVMTSSQLLGGWGAWSHWKGYGPNTQPVGGLVSLWDYADEGLPAGTMSIFPDHLAGRVCALASLAALYGREQHGSGGAHVRVAQVETVTGVLGDLLGTAAVQPGRIHGNANRNERGAPWGTYPCDGEQQWVAITCASDAQWQALALEIGGDLVADQRFSTAEGRQQNASELDEIVGAYTSDHDPYDLQDRMQSLGVPAGVMLTGSMQLDDPHLVHRGYPVEIDQPEIGPISLEGPAFQATGMERVFIAPAPFMGEHTVETCRDLLGIDQAEIDRMVAEGALEVPPG